MKNHPKVRTTAALSEARTTLPESSCRPLPAKMAHSRNLAHASLETAVHDTKGREGVKNL